ncbi:MAG: hypothetical protein K0Q73_8807 [Paenibacillus sp.]|jgi:hypothetical protein|nr:hypothetical protein [Paenibacillus sp.]
MRPIGTNGQEMSKRAMDNLIDFVVRANNKIAAKRMSKGA